MIRHILTTTVTNVRESSPRLLFAGASVIAELEERILDLNQPVVRTRVRDESIWQALLLAGVHVLVETDEAAVRFADADSNADSVEAVVDVLRAENGFAEEGK
jgi:hypothetical protein